MSAERRIGETVYRMTAVPATVSIAMMVEAGKIVGPGLDKLLGTYAATVGGEKDTAPAMASAVMEILKSVQSPADVARFLERFVALAQVKRPSGAWEAASMDGDITERPGDLVPLLGFIAEEAWGGFFSDLGGSLS